MGLLAWISLSHFALPSAAAALEHIAFQAFRFMRTAAAAFRCMEEYPSSCLSQVTSSGILEGFCASLDLAKCGDVLGRLLCQSSSHQWLSAVVSWVWRLTISTCFPFSGASSTPLPASFSSQ